MDSKKMLLLEIEQRHTTRSLGYPDAAGVRHSQVSRIGEALYEAAQKAKLAPEEELLEMHRQADAEPDFWAILEDVAQ